MSGIFDKLFAKADKNDGDGVISAEELDAVSKLLNNAGGHGPVLAILMKAADVDGSGSLDKAEFQRYFSVLSYPQETMDAFEKLIDDLPGGAIAQHVEQKIADLPEGWVRVPSQSRPGGWTYMNSILGVKVRSLDELHKYMAMKGAEVGKAYRYWAGSLNKWLDCHVTETGSDGRVKIDIKPGVWIDKSKLQTPFQLIAFQEEEAAAAMDDVTYEFTEKPGFINGPPEDQVQDGNQEAAKAKVMADPQTYRAVTVGYNGALVYVRKHGEQWVKQADWMSYVLTTTSIKYDGPLFKDVHCEDKVTFNGGLEYGKGAGGKPPMHWKRPGRGHGLYDSCPIMLFGSVEPNDIRQGNVGDCSLIASIAALAECPNALKRLFGGRNTLSKTGQYKIELMDWGTKNWKTFVIDDRVACVDPEAMDPHFAKMSEEGEIFPMLIEKAVAIMAKGFDFCNSIMPTWALGILTGCTNCCEYTRDDCGNWTGVRSEYDGTSTFESQSHLDNVWGPPHEGQAGNIPKSDAEMWYCLKAWDDLGFLACCGVAKPGMTDASKTPTGIFYTHAYSLIKIMENAGGTGINMLQCRNPHGQTEPTLPWADGDSKWTQNPQVQAACAWYPDNWKNDGTFWCEDKDWFQNYNKVYLVKCDLEKKNVAPSVPQYG